VWNVSNSVSGLDRISLIGSLYRIISKALANRLRVVMREVVVTVKSGLSSMCGLSLPLHQSAKSFSFYGLWKGVDPFKARVFCWLAIL
jgi:hypothetical protein